MMWTHRRGWLTFSLVSPTTRHARWTICFVELDRDLCADGRLSSRLIHAILQPVKFRGPRRMLTPQLSVVRQCDLVSIS